MAVVLQATVGETSDLTPSVAGWTNFHEASLETELISNVWVNLAAWWKKLDGSETSNVNFTQSAIRACVHFLFYKDSKRIPVTGALVTSLLTDSDPPPVQTINADAGSVPLAVLALYAGYHTVTNFSLTERQFSIAGVEASEAEYLLDHGGRLRTSVKRKTYTANPVDIDFKLSTVANLARGQLGFYIQG